MLLYHKNTTSQLSNWQPQLTLHNSTHVYYFTGILQKENDIDNFHISANGKNKSWCTDYWLSLICSACCIILPRKYLIILILILIFKKEKNVQSKHYFQIISFHKLLFISIKKTEFISFFFLNSLQLKTVNFN